MTFSVTLKKNSKQFRMYHRFYFFKKQTISQDKVKSLKWNRCSSVRVQLIWHGQADDNLKAASNYQQGHIWLLCAFLQSHTLSASFQLPSRKKKIFLKLCIFSILHENRLELRTFLVKGMHVKLLSVRAVLSPETTLGDSTETIYSVR